MSVRRYSSYGCFVSMQGRYSVKSCEGVAGTIIVRRRFGRGVRRKPKLGKVLRGNIEKRGAAAPE